MVVEATVMEAPVVGEMEVSGAAEVVETMVAEVDVVRQGRSASPLVGRGRKLLYPLPHVCSSCEELRTSFQLRLPQVPFIFMASVCVSCSILVQRIVLLRNPVLLD